MNEEKAKVRRLGTKQVGADEARALASAWRENGERLVVAVGTFDLIGLATAHALARARTRGTRLIAAVLGDHSAAGRLGAGAPVLRARDRAVVVAALKAVDAVFVLVDGQEERQLEALGPAIRVAVEERGLAAHVLARRVGS